MWWDSTAVWSNSTKSTRFPGKNRIKWHSKSCSSNENCILCSRYNSNKLHTHTHARTHTRRDGSKVFFFMKKWEPYLSNPIRFDAWNWYIKSNETPREKMCFMFSFFFLLCTCSFCGNSVCYFLVLIHSHASHRNHFEWIVISFTFNLFVSLLLLFFYLTLRQDAAAFREFLLVKLINGEKATFQTPTFSRKRERTLEMLIKDLYEEYAHDTKMVSSFSSLKF